MAMVMGPSRKVEVAGELRSVQSVVRGTLFCPWMEPSDASLPFALVFIAR